MWKRSSCVAFLRVGNRFKLLVEFQPPWPPFLTKCLLTLVEKKIPCRSQNCLRLGTSRDKKCSFHVASSCFELSFSTIAVFWERKLRAKGFLRKDMGICAVVGCSSSTYQLQKWRKGFCTTHNCHRASQDCTCPELFQLYPFPTLKGDPEKSGLNPSIGKTLKQGKTGSQAKTTGFVPNILWMDNLP